MTKKYEVLIHRTIGEVYTFIVDAESEDSARKIIDEKSESGDLEFSKDNLKYDEITEEFVLSVENLSCTI